MAYQFDLAGSQQLYVGQQGQQTAIALTSNQSGQQQEQQSSFATGTWQGPPHLFRAAAGYVLRIEAQQGQFFVQIQGSSLQLLSSPPALSQAELLSGQLVQPDATPFSSLSMAPMQPMQPMKPMQPMQMGNMQMEMNPMQMRMGEMELQMEAPASVSPTASEPTNAAETAPTVKQFCPQCGQKTSSGDRFCAYCGHQLAEPVS